MSKKTKQLRKLKRLNPDAPTDRLRSILFANPDLMFCPAFKRTSRRRSS